MGTVLIKFNRKSKCPVLTIIGEHHMNSRNFYNLGNYLKEKRMRAGITQVVLSEALKVNVQIVSHWERGICAPPSHCFQQTLNILKADRAQVVEVMLQDAKIQIEAKIIGTKQLKAG